MRTRDKKPIQLPPSTEFRFQSGKRAQPTDFSCVGLRAVGSVRHLCFRNQLFGPLSCSFLIIFYNSFSFLFILLFRACTEVLLAFPT